MKKLMLLAGLLVFALTACGGRTGAKPSRTGSVEKEKTTTVSLSKADFLRKVVDYEGNPDQWRFLGDKPAIIDFYADWCGPCRNIAPILESLAQEYSGRVDIYKIDVDNEQELAAVFGISNLPTVLFVPMDGSPHIIKGSMPKKEFVRVINNVLLEED